MVNTRLQSNQPPRVVDEGEAHSTPSQAQQLPPRRPTAAIPSVRTSTPSHPEDGPAMDPPPESSNQASRTRHSSGHPPCHTTEQLVDLLHRQEKLIRDQAKAIEALQAKRDKTDPTYHPSHTGSRTERTTRGEESDGESRFHGETKGNHRDSIPKWTAEEPPVTCGAKHPFSPGIMTLKLPSHLDRPTNMEQYDGSSDPQDHLDAFEASMLFHGASDPIMCRAFPLTLKRAALQWFTHLETNSITRWRELADRFSTRFTASKEQPRSSYTLSGIAQGTREPIRDYLDRFNEASMRVKRLNPAVAVHLLVTGLQPSLFKIELAKDQVNNMDDLRARAQKFINLEETPNAQPVAPDSRQEDPGKYSNRAQNSEQRKGGNKPKYSSYTPLNTTRTRILREVLSTELVGSLKPRPIRRQGQKDKTRFCEFHNGYGHVTDECTQLQDTIEDQIREGKLQQYKKRQK